MKIEKTINLKQHSTYSIELKGSGTTGFEWVAFPVKNDVISTKKTYSKNGLRRELLGSSANEIFTITALKKGKTILHLKQIEVWKKDPKPAAEFNYEIIVD
ncbi:MAG: protease inhibitor I42 family protein [Saprospiraceae bacterium]